ncbi:MarR family winged helix-turn-helix transcriptional regulator [Kitasatospora sp. NPDC090091]|uniref:MarR family winged helix-turn-helix transcriptional regulator n=1 Tax=Kitasatospora sp. NPDC090091 TaxID=3364081 RepID=UPI003814DFDC
MTTKREPGTDEELLDAVGPAFGRLRRSSLLDVEDPISQKDLSRTLVLRIVQDAAHEGGREVTVGAVAEHLGVDPSVGSRMVSDCISAGYLVRAASQQDGRRTVLLLSPDGEGLMDRFRRHQRAAFEQITADWSGHDRLEFARLLVKYVESQDALRHHAQTRRTAR